jgi:hypothetical protein
MTGATEPCGARTAPAGFRKKVTRDRLRVLLHAGGYNWAQLGT